MKFTSFDTLEATWQEQHDTTITFEAAARDPKLCMTPDRLHDLRSVSAGDVRLLLFCALHIGRWFVGDGFLYDSRGRQCGEEWLAQTVPLHLGPECLLAHVPSRILIAPARDRPHLHAPIFTFRSSRSGRISSATHPLSVPVPVLTIDEDDDEDVDAVPQHAPRGMAQVVAEALSSPPVLWSVLATLTAGVLIAAFSRRRSAQ